MQQVYREGEWSGVPTSSSPRSPFNQDQKEAVSMAVAESCEWSHVTGGLCGESGCTDNEEPIFRDLGHRFGCEGRELITSLRSAVCSSG